MEGGFLMQNYSIIPAMVSTNIKHGTFTYTQNGDGEISFFTYKTPDKDFVYKASLCSLNSHTEPFNLGTFKPENDIYHLEFKMPLHDNDLAIVIYLKDTKENDITIEAYCVLSDKTVKNIHADTNDDGTFYVKCDFENDEDISDKADAIESAQKVLEDYKLHRPPSDESLGINKEYFERLKNELALFEEFKFCDEDFKWYYINTFTIPANLSSVKYVLFDTLSINAFDTHKHYLFGIKDECEGDESYYIAVALPAKINPVTHLDGYAKKMSYSENYDYYCVFIELAPDGQYFLNLDSEN